MAKSVKVAKKAKKRTWISKIANPKSNKFLWGVIIINTVMLVSMLIPVIYNPFYDVHLAITCFFLGTTGATLFYASNILAATFSVQEIYRVSPGHKKWVISAIYGLAIGIWFVWTAGSGYGHPNNAVEISSWGQWFTNYWETGWETYVQLWSNGTIYSFEDVFFSSWLGVFGGLTYLLFGSYYIIGYVFGSIILTTSLILLIYHLVKGFIVFKKTDSYESFKEGSSKTVKFFGNIGRKKETRQKDEEEKQIKQRVDEQKRNVIIPNANSGPWQTDELNNLDNVDVYFGKINISNYKGPSTDLLEETKPNREKIEKQKQLIKENIEKINHFFFLNKIDAKVENTKIGPSFSTFEISVDMKTKVSEIVKKEKDIKLILSSTSIRIEAPIPGTNLIGIEIPNLIKQTFGLKKVLSKSFDKLEKNQLSIPLGLDVEGRPFLFNITTAPHLLIAGTTGSGKSVCLNIILCSLLLQYNPNELKLMIIDPKRVEFSAYQEIEHLITPIIYDSNRAIRALQEVEKEMLKRYEMFQKSESRNIKEYNEKTPNNKLPFVVVVIDELADLMLTNKNLVERLLVIICQKSRAAGIHIIAATQRPSSDIITGLIKANFPSRIAFSLPSWNDSKIIIDSLVYNLHLFLRRK